MERLSPDAILFSAPHGDELLQYLAQNVRIATRAFVLFRAHKNVAENASV